VILGLLVGGLLALSAYTVQSYERAPDPQDLWRFSGWPGQQINGRFLSVGVDSLKKKQQALNKKSGQITWSVRVLVMLALIVGFVALEGLIR